MKTILKLALLILFSPILSRAATVYVSQSGGSVSCGADGTQSTTALGSVTWTSSNVYKLCGTITSDVVVGADSVSIVFENNASIQVGGTGCGNGCIQLAGHNSGLIDGGTPCGANTTCAKNFGDYGMGAKGNRIHPSDHRWYSASIHNQHQLHGWNSDSYRIKSIRLQSSE